MKKFLPFISSSVKKESNLNNTIFGKNYLNLQKKYLQEYNFDVETIQKVINVNLCKIKSCIDLSKKLQKILLLGEVQSGKTNNMIFLVQVLKDMGFNKFILLTGTKNNLNEQNVNRFIQNNPDDKFINFKDKESFFHFNEEVEFIYGIKQNLVNIMNNLSESNYENILNFKLAIIDDESDEFSSEKGKESRTTNNILNNILNKFETQNTIYFSVTATPYANLTSNTDSLSPDYVVPLVSSENYCGIYEFKKNNLYSIIDKENEILLKDFDNYNFNENKIISYFKDLIKNFAYKCFQKKQNFQFLINIDSQVTRIDLISEILEIALNVFKASDDSVFKEFLGQDEIKDFKILLDKILIKTTHQNIQYKRNEEAPEIIIGGNLLSRGITFDSLIYEIMLNIPQSGDITSDTLLQRARWFGYRNKYLKYMKIFVSQKGYDFYNEIIYNVEKEIRDLYKYDFEHNKEKLEKIKKIFDTYNVKYTN